MRKTTKVLFGSAAVLATAALVQIATPATADADTVTNPLDGKITVNAAEQTLTVDSEVLGAAEGKNRQIYFGIAKVSVSKSTDKGTLTEPKKWDVYDTAGSNQGALTISLASLKNTADNYIQIKGSENADPVTILIPKAVKYRAEFNPTASSDNLTVTRTTKTSGKYDSYSGDNVDIRTQYGSWENKKIEKVDADTFATYQEQGATLYLRVPATKSDDRKTTYVKKVKEGKTTKEVDVTVKQVDSFASAEFKLAIKKRPDASAVKVDFLNSTLSLKKGYEYRVLSEADLGTDVGFVGGKDDKKVDYDKNATVDITKEMLASGAEAMIEQRQAAVTTGEKQAIASKVAQLKITRAETPDVSGIDTANENACLDKTVGDVTIGKVDAKKKLTIENASETTIYQVLLQANDKAKWKDIPVQKTKNSKVTPGKVTFTLTDKATPLSIRVKGDAKAYKLSSLAASLGKVKYDADAIKAEEADKANKAIGDAVAELIKENSAVAGTSDAVKVAEDKKLTLPKEPTGVIYTWATTNEKLVKKDGTLADNTALASQSFDTSTGEATVTLSVTVKATNGTDKKVYFVVTVKKTVDGDNTTYAITKVAPGTETDPAAPSA